MSTGLRRKLMHVLDIVLRVPPVFAMDAILSQGYAYEYSYRTKPSSGIDDEESVVAVLGTGDAGGASSTPIISSISFDLQTAVAFVLSMLGFLVTFVIFLLSRQHLVTAYKWIFSLGTIFVSYWSNSTYLMLKPIPDAPFGDRFTSFCAHVLMQAILALSFCVSQNRNKIVAAFALVTFLAPSFISATLTLPEAHLKNVSVISALVCLTYYKICLFSKVRVIYHLLAGGIRRGRMIMRYYGLHTLLENEWLRLNIPHVLRIFWFTRLVEHVVFVFADRVQGHEELQNVINFSLFSMSSVIKDLLVKGCDTMIAVLGMTSVVASISHYLGYAMHCFLMTEDEEEKSIGTVSAVLFFILALQTGLTGLEPEKRFIRLYRNFCLLFTAILHFTHNMVNPLLMSLSASRNRSIQKHGRALIVCGFLIICPCWFVIYLWSQHTISTWLLAVSAFSIEVVTKVIISLLIYLLFMIDAYRNMFWEQLDDYVYYIRATGNTIEFFFGIFLFFNGAWILLFESGGAIRACMMCIHAYFNIWLQAKAGWKTFMKRRTAVNKINALPEATEEQLQRFDDVCAICYQELTNARITKCNHYFHGVCLRKWLYVQDRCPLCHDTLYKLDSDAEVEGEGLLAEDNLDAEPQENEDAPPADVVPPTAVPSAGDASSEPTGSTEVNSYITSHPHQD